ncbi:MAG: TetR/AcrR family transcriptional regulator [Cyanobacteria bacterium REEB67]|nr:TetR/AcrR family transcriptional regulator [Cyanobacteria bacterium REEB67]
MVEDSVDLKERILITTETLLRRYGASKLSVVDVAREIGMSHGNIYRFFSSKALLMSAIAERWLCKVEEPLAQICTSILPADQKLEKWLFELRAIKRHKFQSDPQLFAIYGEVAEQARDEVRHHIDVMIDQLEQIIIEGNKAGTFTSENPRESAVAVLNATARLHHPLFVGAPDYPDDEAARRLVKMVITALRYDGKTA